MEKSHKLIVRILHKLAHMTEPKIAFDLFRPCERRRAPNRKSFAFQRGICRCDEYCGGVGTVRYRGYKESCEFREYFEQR